jgi:hypothetical protein
VVPFGLIEFSIDCRVHEDVVLDRHLPDTRTLRTKPEQNVCVSLSGEKTSYAGQPIGEFRRKRTIVDD